MYIEIMFIVCITFVKKQRYRKRERKRIIDRNIELWKKKNIYIYIYVYISIIIIDAFPLFLLLSKVILVLIISILEYLENCSLRNLKYEHRLI